MSRLEKMPIAKTLVLSCFFIVQICLTIQYKINNVAAVRPLYQFGLIFACFLILIWVTVWRVDGKAALKKIKAIILSRIGKIAAGLFLYVGASALFAGERAFKDFLYFFVLTMISVFASLLLASAAGNMQRFLKWVTVGVAAQAGFASVVAIALRFGLDLDFGEYSLKQAYWVSGRLHGYLGDSIAFGGLIGLALICVASWWPSRLTASYFFWYGFMVACLIWSDSRNALLSSFIALCVFFSLTKRFKELVIAGFTLVISYFIVLGHKKSQYIFLRVDEKGSEDNHPDVSNELKDMLSNNIFLRAEEKGSEDSRLYIWQQVFERLEASNLGQILFGHGAQSLTNDYRSGFNTILETLHDFGIIGLVLFVGVVLYAAQMLLQVYKSDRFVSAFGLSLIAYFVVFSQFWTTFPRSFFAYPVFAMILAVVIGLIASTRHYVFDDVDEWFEEFRQVR
jgi:O-antigen ligase